MTRFSPDFLDELRARLRASDVVGRHVKLKKEGREWRGLSPFTNEKTPSFFVNDEKARYFDFSSNKSGDVIHFLMEHQKLSFVEAVTRLAEEAGLALPQDDPAERRREERAKGLAEACGAAAAWFRGMLGTAEGADARAYLDRRKVSPRAREVFGLGYAPKGRTALKDHLTAQGFAPDVLIEAGLLIRLDDGTTYDRFRDRLIFPILGTRDRVIAFGGRALSSGAKAKYLNSPETPLFHKSRVLFDFARARRRAGEGRPLLVCEGYMDVIAAAAAGFAATAPLGTALTEGQLGLLWRAADEPVLCFDGDRAGRAAAYRALDRALPLLAPGKSLRFAFLPEGKDPDDLVRQDGAEALRSLVEGAAPLAEVLWSHHQESHPRRTPEEAAGFKRALWQKIAQIKDKDVNEAYADFVRKKLGDGAGPASASPHKRPWMSPADFRRLRDAPAVSPALKARLGSKETAPSDAVREAQLVLTLIHHPRLFADHEDQILALDVADQGLKDLLGRTIDWLTEGGSLDSGALRSHLLASPGAAQTYGRWLKHPQIRMVARLTGPEVPYELAEEGWLNALSIDRYQGDLAGEVAEAATEAHLDPGREKSWFDAFNHRARLLAENKPDDDK